MKKERVKLETMEGEGFLDVCARIRNTLNKDVVLSVVATEKGVYIVDPDNVDLPNDELEKHFLFPYVQLKKKEEKASYIG